MGRISRQSRCRMRFQTKPARVLIRRKEDGFATPGLPSDRRCPNGIEAAKRANMRCVALTTSFKRDKLSGADFIVGSYPEIDLSAF